MRGSKLITAALAVAIVGAGVTAAEVVTPGTAQAHTGDLHANYVCQTDGQYKVTYTLDITQTNLVGSTLWGIGTTTFQGTPTSATNPITLNNGPVPSTGAGTITLGTQLLPGTTTVGPWVYAFTTWSDNYKKGSDGRVDQFPGTCRAPESVTVGWVATDGTCVSPNGSLAVTFNSNKVTYTGSAAGTAYAAGVTAAGTFAAKPGYVISGTTSFSHLFATVGSPCTTPVSWTTTDGTCANPSGSLAVTYNPDRATYTGSTAGVYNFGQTATGSFVAKPGYTLVGNASPYSHTFVKSDAPCHLTPTASYTPPTCTTPGSVTLGQNVGYTWTDNGVAEPTGKTYTAVAAQGYALDGTKVFGPWPTAQLTGAPCTVPANPKATITTECGGYDIELSNVVSPPQGFTAPAVTFIVTIDDGVPTEHIVQPQGNSQTSTAVHLTDTFGEDSGDHSISVSIKGSEAAPVTATVETDCELNDAHPSLTAVPPTCLAAGSVTLGEAIGFHWLENEDGTFTAVANEGFKIVGTTTFGPFAIARLIGRACEDPINFKAVTVACGAITFSNVGTPAAGQYGVAAVFVTNPELAGGPVTVPFGESTTRTLTEDLTDTDQVVEIIVDGTSYSVPTDCVKAAVEVLPPTQPAPAPVPPTTAETTPILPPSGGLPVTGSSPWTTLWIALAALGAGGLVVRLSRRSTS